MSIEDALGFAIPVVFFVLLAAEPWLAGRRFPTVRRWRWIGVAALVVVLILNVSLPLLIPPDALRAIRLVDGERLGIAGGAVVGYLALSGVTALWHRLEHGVPFLWRWVHQFHHSPRRVDLAGAFYLHPFEVVVQIGLTLVLTVGVLGLDPVAASVTGFIGAFYAMFQHWNVRTPRWLGYLIQRPESHCLHHEKEVHGRNYSDLPLWDMLMGSFHNPERFEGEVGFEPAAARRVGAMLVGVDVNAGAAAGLETAASR